MTRLLRSFATLVLFALFGLGSVLLAPLMLVLRRPERCQPVVRTAWRPLVWAFRLLRLVAVERTGEIPGGGAVIVANHPSLIDVVLVSVLVPRTLYVAKRALRSNPFVAAIVRATSLPDDATLPESAAPYLRAGWNVLVFPEGTRSPSVGLHPFRRGTAQLALRTGAPVVPLRISMSRRVLGKRQPITDIGSRTIRYRFEFLPSVPVAPTASGLRSAAARLTETLAATLSRK